MRRRTAVALSALVAAFTLVAMAGPVSAAPLQNFTLTKNGSTRVAVAQGSVVNGVGTFTEASETSKTILLPGTSPIVMTLDPSTAVQNIDPRTCKRTVVETGTFTFDTHIGEATIGGSGPYTLAGSQTGTKLPGGGCAFASPVLSQYTITATSTEIHAIA